MTDNGNSPAGGERDVASASRVASAMLHEIRNILNPIVSASYLLGVNADNPDKVRELAARIEGFAKAEERVAARMREFLAREAAGEELTPGAGISDGATPSSTHDNVP